MNDLSGKRLLGGSCVGALKYKWLILKIQEYPVNKQLLALTEKELSPSCAAVKNMPSRNSFGSPTERRALRISAWADSMFDRAHRNTWTKWKARFILEYADIIGEGEYIDMLIEYGPELCGSENGQKM